MLEKNQRFKSLLYVLADAALLFIGFLLANYIRFNYVRYFEPGGAGPALAVARDPRNIIAGLATSLVLVLIYWVAGIYSTTRLRGLAERCTKIAVINAAGLLIFIGALYLMHLDDYSRIVLALFYILGTAGVVIERMILRWVDRARRREGLGLRHILLVGGGKSAALYLRALEHNPYYGFVVDGYLAERGADCVTTVPAEPSLFKFFGTVGFAPCFSTRKLELLKSMLQPAAEGDRAEPVEPGEYNAIRRRLLEGAPAVDYPEELIRYQQGMGRLSGGGLYRLSVDGAEGCAAAEYTDGESVLFKELLLSPDKMGRGLAALERVLPGARCYVRTPALWDGMKGSYLQPFGMIKWYSAEKRALWGEGTHGYMGLGFD